MPQGNEADPRSGDRGASGHVVGDQGVGDQVVGGGELDDPEADLRDNDGRKGIERTCIVRRTKGSPDGMIRFVVGPEGAVVPDVRRRLPGRGVWVTASQAIVAEAVRKQAFARGFRAKVVVDAALAVQVGLLLARDALQSLAMANKAGAVTTGFAKVEAAIAAGRVMAVLHASEASADGVRKLDAVRRRLERQAGPAPDAEGCGTDEARLPPSIKLFASDELDLALGRTNVIHAALAEGPAGQAFLTRCQRAIDYRAEASQVTKADAKAASAESGTPG